jgi:hypothetical protein
MQSVCPVIVCHVLSFVFTSVRTIHFQNGNSHITQFKTNERRVDGICGNMDGDIANDWRTCDDKIAVAVNDAASLDAIAASCKDFTHDAQGYRGGTKLNSTSYAAGFPV